jgi:hypothetical protein
MSYESSVMMALQESHGLNSMWSVMMALQESHGLNSMCFRDKTLWMIHCPLIFYYAVEYHHPSRVIRQFGLEQPIHPPCPSTSVELHRYVHNCIIYMYHPSYI